MSKYRDKVREKNSESKGATKFKLPKALSENQEQIYKSLQTKVITIIDGPAGTGKTMLSVAEALNQHFKGEVHKIIIVRPLVTVGEDLGFLPGGLQEKISPYLTHLLEYFGEFLSKNAAESLINAGVIEMVPFALVRGRTFKNAFVIVDEAQNTTPEQMLAILTRIGEGSRMVVIGDIEQKDILNRSGLLDLLDRVDISDTVGVVATTEDDIQRHPIIREILGWYNEDNK